MSSTPSAAPLCLEPSPSRRLAGWVLAAHMGAAAAAVATPLPAPVRGLLLAAAALSLVRAWPALARSVRVTWDREGRWWWEEAGRCREVALRPDSYCRPARVVLRFQAEGWRSALVLLPDSLDAEALRRLRVRLLQEGAGPPEP